MAWSRYSLYYFVFAIMVLESTQPLTEMDTRNFHGGKGWPARKADNLTAICEPTVYKMWKPRRLWASTASYRDSFTFCFYPAVLQSATTKTHSRLFLKITFFFCGRPKYKDLFNYYA
jgi:hypothetical protein